ncbi:uncharacterized protein LOC110835249 isoform X2 [Zootermopsis nevadensis]|uniref:uncharacterized protein LOC110835249 isoform X2 n=1 Tax=Zootermopsis nevadensis TaxID=136037 RepID=UPI000B8E481C|nr:uncharacterized protein LOC110835249 isoform X2 [Zootermopsis nevadensis]
MRHKAQLLLLLMLLVWVEVDGSNQDGIKSRRDEKQESKEESDTKNDQNVYLNRIDSIRSNAVRIVPAPDLSKSEEKWKGDDDSEAGDVEVELLSEQAKWIQRMIAEVEGVGTELLDEGDEETVDVREDEIEDLTTVHPPRELTPLEKQALKLYESGLAMLNVTRPNKLEAYQMLQRAGELGHSQARVLVAWAQLLGSPMPQDIETAKQAFQELVELGVPDAHMGLGFLYATGIAVNASQARAIVHYTFGAIGGSLWAQMALGYRYWSGVTVATSCERALDFYRKVANKDLIDTI